MSFGFCSQALVMIEPSGRLQAITQTMKVKNRSEWRAHSGHRQDLVHGKYRACMGLTQGTGKGNGHRRHNAEDASEHT